MDEELEVTDTGMTPDEFDLAFEAALGAPIPEVDEKKDEVVPPEVVPPEVVPPEDAEAAQKKADAEKAQADAAAQKKADAEKAQADAEKAKTDAAAAQKAERASKEQPTAEEAKALEEFRKDFPDVAKALDAQVRLLSTKYENRIAELEQQVGQQIDQRVAPVMSVVQPMVSDAHTKAILEKHADAIQKLPEIEKWVGEQPGFLQTTYNQVLDKGSAAQVVELIDLFKKDTGTVPPAGPSAEEVARKQAEDAAKEKKLQSQEAVRGRQSNKSSVIPDDFESAFDVFAAQA
jgi:hypothetical protein